MRQNQTTNVFKPFDSYLICLKSSLQVYINVQKDILIISYNRKTCYVYTIPKPVQGPCKTCFCTPFWNVEALSLFGPANKTQDELYLVEIPLDKSKSEYK